MKIQSVCFTDTGLSCLNEHGKNASAMNLFLLGLATFLKVLDSLQA